MHVITVGGGQSLSIIKFWTLDYFVTQFNVEENDCEVEIMNKWLGCPRKRDSSAASCHFFLPFPQQKPESDHTSLVVLTLLFPPPTTPHPLSSYWGLKGREATLSTHSCPADRWLVRCCRSWQHVQCQIIHLTFFFFFFCCLGLTGALSTWQWCTSVLVQTWGSPWTVRPYEGQLFLFCEASKYRFQLYIRSISQCSLGVDNLPEIPCLLTSWKKMRSAKVPFHIP